MPSRMSSKILLEIVKEMKGQIGEVKGGQAMTCEEAKGKTQYTHNI